MAYRYDHSPVCVPDGTPPPVDNPMVYEQTARPGSRAPHAWLADGRSTLDLFGQGFTLLQFGGGAGEAQPLLAAAGARGVPVTRVAIDQPDVAALYERRFVLVRPDGHVAWRSDAIPANPQAIIDTVVGMPARTDGGAQ